MLLTVFFTLCVLSYSVALGILLMSLKRGTLMDKQPIFWLVSIAAVLTHGIILYKTAFFSTGYNLSLFKTLSLVSWTIVCFLLFTGLRKPITSLAVLFYPLALVTLGVDQFFSPEFNLGQPLKGYQSWQHSAHIVLSIAAYSFLTIAVVQSVLLAIQHKRLHAHRPGGFLHALPPLQIMEQLLFEIIVVGFLLLTVGLLIGLTFLQDMFRQHLVHKTVLSLAAWCLFAVLLWGRWRFGWRGRKIIRLALGGFILLMLAFIGTQTVFELILNRTRSA